MAFAWECDTLFLKCKEAFYQIPSAVIEKSEFFCWDIPSDGTLYQAKGTFAFISRQALRNLQEKGFFIYDNITWRLIDQDATAIHVRADIDQTEMWISLKDDLPLVLEMRNNPLGIDWNIE